MVSAIWVWSVSTSWTSRPRRAARSVYPDAYQPLRGLGFGQCRLMIAVPEEWEWQGVAQLAGKRIATSYPAILGAWLQEQGVDAQVVELSVFGLEIAPSSAPPR